MTAYEDLEEGELKTLLWSPVTHLAPVVVNHQLRQWDFIGESSVLAKYMWRAK